MKKSLLLLCSCLFTFSVFSQESDKETWIKQLIADYKKHESISYDMTYSFKFFDSEVPVYVHAPVLIRRIESDTIFKAKFFYQRKDTTLNISKYYDGQNLYVIDHNEEKIMQFDVKKGQTGPITGNIDGDVLDSYFLDIEKLEQKLDNKKITKTYIDSVPYLKISFRLPDDEEFQNREQNVYLNKNTRSIDKITYTTSYKDQTQENEWTLTNIIFDKVKDTDFDQKIKEDFQQYRLTQYEPLTQKDYALLANGSAAPELKGKIFPDYEKEVTLKSDKILILDFWYTSCMPCIKAIPHLNRLQEKYKDHIQVVGVNPIEYKQSHTERIHGFLKRNLVAYPLLLIDETPKAYNLRAYPTLYILKDGKVAYSKIGSSENLYDELEKVLKELIH